MLRAIIIGSEPALRDGVRTWLRKAGHEVVGEFDFVQEIEFAEAPHLAVTLVARPESRVEDAAEEKAAELRSHFPNIQILALSHREKEEWADRSLRHEVGEETFTLIVAGMPG